MRSIDAARLPSELVALIDALRPGEDLLITRDGEPIASISGHAGADESASADSDDVTVVATAMKLSAAARASLSEQLGPGYIVLDMKSAPKTVDVLLTPPHSPQLIGHFRSMFPKARVVIAEIEDDEFGVSFEGPVRRLLDAGADTYLPPSSIPRLARQLDRAMTQLNQLTGSTSAPLTIESPQVHNGLGGG
ncbi:type II toxin-antitoxin system Phd/YefM family antitoxin [Amycolatopsis sp. NPDC059657]|uniref:type II toxin-antitoxin system Phd/YefM family antitoxin n=1 Tax=Amycolatopsis sp. NPDC059657 TaxID=3346899 RepID=UPI00366DB43D